jgi:MFS family permease
VAFDFRATALAAAAVFAVLTVGQLFALPKYSAASVAAKTSVIEDWRAVVTNRSFLAFAAAMIGSYVLSFQVYLALPLQALAVAPHSESWLVAGIFVISGLIAVAGQLRITRWFVGRWGSGRSLAIGMAILAGSYLPLVIIPDSSRFGLVAGVSALLACAALLAVGSAAIFPFEMDTVVALSGERLVATHYGFYNTIVGTGILIGNLLTGSLMDVAQRHGLGALFWAGLLSMGLLAGLALHRLDRRGRLQPAPVSQI